jgi:hypothetical protein
VSEAAGDLAHINMRRWPFTVVPSDESAEAWIGRAGEKRKVDRVLRSAERIAASQLVLVWAEYGAGKTHALRYLRNRAASSERIVPIYVATPRGIRSFVDLHRGIIDAAAETGALEHAGRLRLNQSPATDVERALQALAFGSTGAPAELARAWLRGDRVPIPQLRGIGISRRIEATIDAVAALNEVIAALKGVGNLTLLIDEVQELEELTKQRHDECVGGLQKVFDRNTEGLTLVLSFTTAAQANVGRIIGNALFDRASVWLTLPALTRAEGVELISGLLEFWSIDPARAPFPFEQAAIEAAIDALDDGLPQLSPRAVINHFNSVLREAELDIDEGHIPSITGEYALENLELD